MSLSQYEVELDRLSAAVALLADRPLGIPLVRNSVPASWVVDTGIQPFEVSAVWLTETLAEMEKKPVERKRLCDEAFRRLKFLRQEAEQFESASSATDDASARSKLQKILSRREFQTVEEKSWLGQLWDQVVRWIEWLLDHTIGRLVGEGPLRTLLVWLVIGIVFTVVSVWLVRRLSSMARTETLHLENLFTPGKTWRDWVRQSQVAAAGGDYRASVHLAYWAGVYRLADVGAWQLDRSRTPREYLRLLDQRVVSAADTAVDLQRQEIKLPPAGSAAALAELTRRMEAVWYGFTPATKQDFDLAFQNLETLGCRLHSTAPTANS